MVGSEGTLGIVVEATLNFVPIPEYRCMGIANFDQLADAGGAIGAIMSSGASLPCWNWWIPWPSRR